MPHQHYMQQALALAEKGRLTTSPNPMVGCVLVKDSTIIATGYHEFPGGPHAEINALRAAGQRAQGATAYVTLEPCCHFGKTPPCTTALIESGIKKVFVSCMDPNPLVAGKGIAQLREAGIEVEVGLNAQEAEILNKIFFHFIRTQQPYVIAKWAMSLDGKTTTHTNDDKKISGTASQQTTHALRQQVDAILVGAHTARIDNPLLTARLVTDTKKQPIRIILSASLDLPAHLDIFSTSSTKTIIVTTPNALANTQLQLATFSHIEIIELPYNNEQQINLPLLLAELGKRNITSLLVEGGMTTLNQFFAEDLVNEVQVFLAPVIIGNKNKKQKITNLNLRSSGEDFLFTSILSEK